MLAFGLDGFFEGFGRVEGLLGALGGANLAMTAMASPRGGRCIDGGRGRRRRTGDGSQEKVSF